MAITREKNWLRRMSVYVVIFLIGVYLCPAGFLAAAPKEAGWEYPYFSVGSSIPAKVSILGAVGSCTAEFRVMDVANVTVFQAKKRLTVSSGKDAAAEVSVSIPNLKCGLYWLQVSVKDAQGQEIEAQEYPFAVIVELPSLKKVSADSPLGVQPLACMPEGRLLGMKWNRIWIYGATWWSIEPSPGNYDWPKVDKLVAESTAAGSEILFTIHGTPDWAASGPPKIGGIDTYLAKDLNVWDGFIRTLVNRYKGKIHYWDIWNESMLEVAKDKDKAAEYVKLLKVAYQAIKETDPDSRVVGINGCPGFLNWTEDVLKAGGGPYFDILGYHNYNYDNPNSWAKKGQVEQLNRLMKQYTGKTVPLWNTEEGFHQPPYKNGRPLSEEEFRKQYSDKLGGNDSFIFECLLMVSNRRCACWEVQAELLDLAAGADKIFLHAGVKDVVPDPSERDVAYAALAKVVSDRVSVKPLNLANENTNGVLVTDQNGERTAVLWTVNDEKIPITLLVEKKTRLYQGMDFLGNPLSYQSSQGILTLTLTQEPLYLLDVPENITSSRIIDVKGPLVIDPVQPYQGELVIYNPFKEPLVVDIKVILPVNWEIAINKTVSLAGGETVTFPFTIKTKNASDGFYPVRIDLVRNNELVCNILKKYLVKNVKPIYRAKGKIVLDGASSDWEGIPEVRVDTLKNVVIGLPNPMFPKDFPHWEGAGDLSYTVKTAWDDEGLYLWVDVVDDKILTVPDKEKKNACYYDCVEVFLDTLQPSLSGACQFFVIPAISDTPANCKIEVAATYGSLIDTKLTRFTGRRTQGGYLCEGRIVFKSGSGFNLKSGSLLGLDVAVDDAGDKPGVRKTQMVLYGINENFYSSPIQWGMYRLTE